MTIDESNVNEIVGDVDEPIVPAEDLSAKYSKQMRQIFPQKIELPITALEQMIKEQIKLDPEFQRRGRWDVRRQSRLIESIIMNVPIPPVFLGEDEYGSYVVLDGRQRLTAVHNFLKSAYALEGLEVWKELNGKRYFDLEKESLNKTLTRRFIPAILLLKESSPEVKYDVFDRLNTGGVTANPMEIRSAIFQGPFNRLLHELSADAAFMEIWGIPAAGSDRDANWLYSTMSDVQLVLRFFALRKPEEIAGTFKWYLGHYMDTRNKAAAKDVSILASDAAEFKRAVTAIKLVFGSDKAFIRPNSSTQSAPLSDAMMVAFSAVDADKFVAGDADKLKQAFNDLEKDEAFRKSVSTGTNGKGAISSRIDLVKKAVAACIPHALLAA